MWRLYNIIAFTYISRKNTYTYIHVVQKEKEINISRMLEAFRGQSKEEKANASKSIDGKIYLNEAIL